MLSSRGTDTDEAVNALDWDEGLCEGVSLGEDEETSDNEGKV